MPTRSPARLSVTRLEDRWTPAAGDLDFSFGDQGVVSFPSVQVGDKTRVRHTNPARIAAMPDGRLVVASQVVVTSLTNSDQYAQASRLTTGGRPDPTFGTDGATVIPFASVYDLQVQPDGTVYVAGRQSYEAGYNFTVARLTTDGRLDPGFGTDGVAILPSEAGDVRSLAVRPDGRVLVAGTIGSGQGTSGDPLTDGFMAFTVAQLTAAGRPDPSFDTDGVATVFYPVGEYNQAGARAIAVQPDGKVVLTGFVTTSSSVSGGTPRLPRVRSYNDRTAVVRLNADGSLDPGFGDGGRTRFEFSTGFYNGGGVAVSVRPDGRIAVVGGDSESGIAILTPTGQLDPAFDDDGLATTPFSPASATFLPDGGFLLNSVGRLLRLTAAGRPDPAFGPNGRADISFANDPFNSFSLRRGPRIGVGQVVPLPDGGLAAAGSLTPESMLSDGLVLGFRGTKPNQFPLPDSGMLFIGGLPDAVVTLMAPLGAADGVYGRVFTPSVYPDFAGIARTAMADVTGDGVADLITGPGPGGVPNVVVLDGKTGVKVADLDAFETTFTGGVFVAAADLDGDGKAEVIVTPDQGGGPVTVVYDGAGLAAGRDEGSEQTRFFGIDDPAFRGGARSAAGDVNGDGRMDLVVAAGFGGGPRVAVYNGVGLFGGSPARLVPDFFVFEQTLRNGVYVAAGDLTGDGAAELVFGGGPGGGPRVFALDGKAMVAGTQTPVANFFAGSDYTRGGVHVTVRTDVAAGSEPRPRIVTGSGTEVIGTVGVYDPAAATAGGGPERELLVLNGFLPDGVFVA